MERKQPDLVLIVARSFATKLATPTVIIDARGDLVYYNDASSPDYYLRLVFGPDGKLQTWKNFAK